MLAAGLPEPNERGTVLSRHFVDLGALGLCAAMAACVLVLDRGRMPLVWPLGGLALIALAFLVAAKRSRAGMAALMVAGLATLAPAYYLGPNAWPSAILSVALVLLGLREAQYRERSPSPLGWLVYGTIAIGHGVLVGLILAGRIPDLSLTTVAISEIPIWHHAVAHLTIQGIYLGSLMMGFRLGRTYAVLAAKVAELQRESAARDKLLQEARDDYRRALALGREGLFSGREVGGFRLGEMLGRGGMGEVYAAVNESGTRFAIKLLRADRVADAAAQQRFHHETQLSARVEGPNLPAIYATGELEGGIPYLAMERLSRESLESRIQGEGALSVGEVLELAHAIASALEALHAAGIFHLDVTPSNVVKADDGQWKLIDFGSATSDDGALQRTGTMAYVAPESLRNEAQTARTDVYGLAATLYAALAGSQPHSGPYDFFSRSEPRWPQRIASLPADLERVLVLGMAPSPGLRFASPRQLAEALARAERDELSEEHRTQADTLLARWRPVDVHQAPKPGQGDRKRSHSEAAFVDTDPEIPKMVETPSVAHPQETRARRSRVTQAAYNNAYRQRLEVQNAMVGAMCVAGGGLLALVIRNPIALLLALSCIAAIGSMLVVSRSLIRRGRFRGYGTWVFIAALGVGPAFAIGLHSGFATILAPLLLVGGLFRASQRGDGLGQRVWVLVAVVLSFALVFTLVALGIIDDIGNVSIRQPGSSWHSALVEHLGMQSIFVVSFGLGLSIDRRRDALLKQQEEAARHMAETEALLATTRQELERALTSDTHGIFTDQIVGDYAIGRILGRGGMGEVYEATSADGTAVAIKLIRRERVNDPVALRSFLREAKALTRIHSPHVSKVLSVGNIDEVPYIAMELVVGKSLNALLNETTRMNVEDTTRMMTDLCKGLEAVHAAGIVHRDIKPMNIMLTSSGRWTLVDFGIAKDLSLSEQTTGRLIFGTRGYMAPEHARGERVDARADLYSLCLVAYRAMAGAPFAGPKSLSLGVGIPPALLTVLAWGLSEAPSGRPESAGALIRRFAGAASSATS